MKKKKRNIIQRIIDHMNAKGEKIYNDIHSGKVPTGFGWGIGGGLGARLAIKHIRQRDLKKKLKKETKL